MLTTRNIVQSVIAGAPDNRFNPNITSADTIVAIDES